MRKISIFHFKFSLYWLMSNFFLFFVSSTFAQSTFFEAHLSNIDRFQGFGEIFLSQHGARLSLAGANFSALSPNLNPPASTQDYAYQVQLTPKNFRSGDQWEFRYFFLPDGSYHSFRCTLQADQIFACQLIKQTAIQAFPFGTVTSHLTLPANNQSYTLLLSQNQNQFKVQFWPTDAPESGRLLAYIDDFYPTKLASTPNLYPPALVLDRNLTTNDDATLIWHYFRFATPDQFVATDVWPYYQTDPQWRNKILGHTDQNPDPQTIGEIGCALTSAVMLFHYYHYSFLPDGSPLTPASLNDWLKNQPDGYINANLLNWQALTRLSTQLHQQYHLSGNSSFPKFEYQFIRGPANDYYWQSVYSFTSLEAAQPLIAEITGHFIVVNKTTLDGQIGIIDPYYPEITALYDQPSSREKIYNFRRFVPSYTDQSYFILNIIGQARVEFTFQNQPLRYEKIPLYQLQTDSDASEVLLGYQYLVPKPTTGHYSIRLSAATLDSQFSFFTYNQNGTLHAFPSASESISPLVGEWFEFDFDKTLDTDFSVFTDNYHHFDTWSYFSQKLSWPHQFIRLQFDHLVNHQLFLLADFYRRHYLERQLISSDLSNQLSLFWQNQV